MEDVIYLEIKGFPSGSSYKGFDSKDDVRSCLRN